MEHQDWTPVIIKKHSADTDAPAKKKPPPPDVIKKAKIEQNAEEGNYRIEKISHKETQNVQQVRTSLGLTQKQLAQKCGIKPSIVQEYERGKVISSSDKAKINKALGITNKKKK